ncbi:MAG: efflux RND transporter periplasmic adaptor subunit [Thermodesulfobacteriota bacterium]
MKNRLIKTLPLLVLLVLAASAVVLVKQRKAELDGMDTAQTPAFPVRVAEAARGTIEVTQHYLGIIEPEVSAAIAARVTGEIESVRFDTGDLVEKNDLVAAIDDREMQEELSALQAELEGAQAELTDRKQRHKRRKNLYSQGHIDEEDLDASKSALVSAGSKVDRLRSQIGAAKISLLYTRIRAPFDGVVTERMKDPGDLVTPGQAICRIENQEKGYKVIVKIDPETAGILQPGSWASLSSGGKTLDAQVFRVYPAADKNRLASAEIRTKKPPFGLPSGAALGVDLVVSTPEALVLPRRAAVEIDGAWHVFIADDDNRIKPAKVSVLGRTSDSIAVKSDDLKQGDRVAVGDESMLIRLGPHTRIQPLQETPAGAGQR